jgi:hypothetical protein
LKRERNQIASVQKIINKNIKEDSKRGKKEKPLQDR